MNGCDFLYWDYVRGGFSTMLGVTPFTFNGVLYHLLYHHDAVAHASDYAVGVDLGEPVAQVELFWAELGEPDAQVAPFPG